MASHSVRHFIHELEIVVVVQGLLLTDLTYFLGMMALGLTLVSSVKSVKSLPDEPSLCQLALVVMGLQVGGTILKALTQ